MGNELRVLTATDTRITAFTGLRVETTGAASWEIAFVNLGLGDLDQAFVWLDRATESRDQDPRSWKPDPFMADVVKDPRYAALLKKFGLDK